MRFIFFLAVFLSVISATAGAHESHTTWLSFEPEVVVLGGFLEEKQFYGPPNYGENPETDRIELALILTLTAPISVRGGEDDDEIIDRRTTENVTEVQLVCEVKLVNCPHFVTKIIQVSGSLFSAHTAHHRAKILMTVSEISEIE